MNYFIQREGEQYGPYTLADLQRYTASGNIALNDLCTSEGQPEPVPVSQIIGTIAVPQSFVPAAGPSISLAPVASMPPNLHWGLVVLFTFLSCGYFLPVWELVLAAWLKKEQPLSKVLYMYIGVVILELAILVVTVTNGGDGTLSLVYYLAALIARFMLKSGLEEHFNAVDPVGLELNGVMTFFFGGIYFQYHMNDIVRRREADRLYEMGR